MHWIVRIKRILLRAEIMLVGLICLLWDFGLSSDFGFFNLIVALIICFSVCLLVCLSVCLFLCLCVFLLQSNNKTKRLQIMYQMNWFQKSTNCQPMPRNVSRVVGWSATTDICNNIYAAQRVKECGISALSLG